MKLLLCSEGFYTPNTVQACVELCGKPQNQIKIGIINEGFVYEINDKRWVIDNLNDVAKNFSGAIDIINLLALTIDEVEERMSACDVIYVIGGNSDYLMYLFEKTGFDKLLAKLLKTKVYVGSSAGSIIIGKRVSVSAYQDMYGRERDFGTVEYLNFVELAIRPHLNEKSRPNNNPETLRIVSVGVPYPVYGLEDNSAIIVDGDELRTIGNVYIVNA